MTCPAESILISRAPLGSGCPDSNSQTPSNWLFFACLPVVCDQATATAASVIGNAKRIFMMMFSSAFPMLLPQPFLHVRSAPQCDVKLNGLRPSCFELM